MLINTMINFSPINLSVFMSFVNFQSLLPEHKAPTNICVRVMKTDPQKKPHDFFYFIKSGLLRVFSWLYYSLGEWQVYYTYLHFDYYACVFGIDQFKQVSIMLEQYFLVWQTRFICQTRFIFYFCNSFSIIRRICYDEYYYLL